MNFEEFKSLALNPQYPHDINYLFTKNEAMSGVELNFTTEKLCRRCRLRPQGRFLQAITSFFKPTLSGEKLAESEEDLLKHRTDGSYALDTLYFGSEKFRSGIVSPSQ